MNKNGENYQKSVSKIKRCVSRILMKGGFFGNFLSEIPIASSDACELFSTDGTIFIFNPQNCLLISDEEIIWSINEGIIHLALLHFDRKADHKFKEWNKACDIISHVYLVGICKSFLPSEYQNSRFINMSAEEVYSEIEKGKIQPSNDYRSYCDVLGPGEILGKSINDVIIGNSPKTNESGKPNESKKIQLPNNESVEKKSGAEGKDLLNADSSSNDWEEPEKNESNEFKNLTPDSNSKDKRKIIDKIKEITERSSNKGIGNGGISPALRKFIDNLINPQIDWKKTLQKYTSEMEEDASFYKIPNRRHIFHDLYLPGLKVKREGLGTIVIAIDTSGSIGNHDYNTFIAETRSVLKSFRPEEIYIIYCSDGIEAPSGGIDKLKSHLQALDLEKQKSTGGNKGGFNPPIEWVEKNLIKRGKNVACMIYFTDGGAENPEKPNWHKKIIWAMTTDRRIPFGKHIDVPINKFKK